MKTGDPVFGKRLIILGVALFVIFSLVFPEMLGLGLKSVEIIMFTISFGVILWGISEIFIFRSPT